MPLKLTQRHGSPNWYLRGSIRGIRVDESTGTGDKKAAEDIRVHREKELLTRSIHGDAVSRTFAEAALSYMEAGGERTHLGPILKILGRKILRNIGQSDIDDAAKRLKPHASPATINRQIHTPIAAVLHHAAARKWCDKPVIERPKQPKGRIRWITQAEAETLIACAAPHLKPLIIFLFGTGARLSEALYLDWSQVDLSMCQVTFIDTKNDEPRSVPLHPRVVATLANLDHRKGAVFRTPRKGKAPAEGKPDNRPIGAPYADRGGEGGGQIKTAWATMCRNAKIEHFTPHDCRHTWATWHYQAHRDLAALMQLGGWKSVEMVMRYAHTNTSNHAAGIAAMWGNNGDTPPRQNTNTLQDNAFNNA